MADKPYAKTPAFFRVQSFDVFFEADALDTEAVVESLHTDVDLDSELDAILATTD